MSIKQGKHISHFKPGQLIIRLKPMITEVTEFNHNLGIAMVVDERKDNCFRTTPGEYIGIYNNLIYMKHLGGGIEGCVAQLQVDDYSEDWAEFEIPKGLTLNDCV